MEQLPLDRYPLVARSASARAWLTIQANFGRAPATIDAYGRALNDYLIFCAAHALDPPTASRAHLAAYVRDLSSRPGCPRTAASPTDRPPGLANATIHQRLTVLRLFYDYLLEEGLCPETPLPRGRWTPSTGFGGARTRALLPRYQTLPWIPTDAQWQTFIELARAEPIRTRCMLAFAYDAALRREELCALTVADIDPAQRLLRIRAETTKNHRERIVPYSAATNTLYAAYLQQRRSLSQARGPLFLSESRRNRAQPLSIWTWSKVVQALAQRADLPAITTHTFRHLCLTDLARAGWELHAIATFAGHRSLASTLRYIHLSGRELAERLARTSASLHASRVQPLLEVHS